jgi:competence protein ComEA
MDPDRLRALARQLGASSAELAGLAVLVVGVVVLTGVVWWTARTPALPDAASEVAAAVPQGEVTVHVSGAVAAPGVLTLPDGARVGDALTAAGGATIDGDPAQLNLARPLRDGEQIVVPVIGAATSDAATGVTDDGLVDLNRASVSELETLPGVGPVLGGRIVAWRDEHGPFTEVGQLREVSGIGEKLLQSLADLVVVR